MARRYTEEQRAWLGARWRSTANRKLADAFEEAFGIAVTPTTMANYGKNRGWRKDPGVWRRALRHYTDEEDAFLRGCIPGRSEREIADTFEARFGRRLTRGQVKNAKTRLCARSGTHGGRFEPGNVPRNKGVPWDEQGLSAEARAASLRTCFKPGNVPANAYHGLLDEKADARGAWVYVRPRNRRFSADDWVSKQRFVWMRANGRDWPDGCRAVFADRNPGNLDPANIVPVPGDIYPIVTGAVRGQVGYCNRKTLETAIASAKVTQARARLAAGKGRKDEDDR